MNLGVSTGAPSHIVRTDFLVIGGGLAGLALALKLADQGEVIILSKESGDSTNTVWAQGGIASVTSQEDSFESHIQDTLSAGAGLCLPEAVENIVHQAPERIKDLIRWGVNFDKTEGKIDLTREGGHSFRRILHHEDSTGREIYQKLLIQARNHKKIQILENQLSIDLILNKMIRPRDVSPNRCLGAYVLDTKDGEVRAYHARATFLATGGAGKAYLYTTNWSGATGDGIAMAYRAGARVANMEFMQFHPTCLYHPQSRNFLISEAVRGEGGELINARGEAFMKKKHPLGSLAPRDIVARSIDAEMRRWGSDCVYLDITSKDRSYLKTRFPAIFAKCESYGIDISKEPIPVVPAAHFLCGGILTDLNGQTDICGLFAVGETACTGLHGANRLASNSLLECVSMAHNAAEYIQSHRDRFGEDSGIAAPWVRPVAANPDELNVITHMWEEIRRLMWNYVGIVRTTKRLERAEHRLVNLLKEVREYYSNYQITSDTIELRNISIVAYLTVHCALKRRESRGTHYNTDYVESRQTEDAVDTVLYRGHDL